MGSQERLVEALHFLTVVCSLNRQREEEHISRRDLTSFGFFRIGCQVAGRSDYRR
jgi:hypothetical protein